MAQPLKPTLKEKKRYVVYEPSGQTAVKDSFRELFGIYGIARAGLMPVEAQNNKAIVRVSHKSVDRIKAALAWCGKRSIKVSGTLKAARAAL